MLHHRLRASMGGNRRATYVGDSSAGGASTLYLPAHQAGDLLVVMSMGGGSSTSIPGGWTVIFNNTGARDYVCYKIAESDAETVGTWSSLYSYTRRCSFVWRGARAQSPIGAASYRISPGMESLTFPAITTNHSQSWLACIGAAKPSVSPFTADGAPTDFPGMTLRFNGSTWRRAWDSDGPKSSLSATTVASDSAYFVTVCFEIAL